MEFKVLRLMIKESFVYEFTNSVKKIKKETVNRYYVYFWDFFTDR